MQPSSDPGPARGPDRVDFAEWFTVAVRRVLPAVAARRLSYAFDWRGPRATVTGDGVALRCALHRAFCATIDVVQSGFVIFDAELHPAGDGSCTVTVKAAGTGVLAADATIDDVLARLGLDERATARAGNAPRLRHATGPCSCSGAEIEFTSLPTQGVLLQWRLRFADAELPDEADPNAGAARAWVVDADPGGADSLIHRLQRLGWATSRFHSLAQAERRLAGMPPRHARPALLLASESAGASPAAMQRLMQTLPPHAVGVLGVHAGSTTLAAADAGDVEIRVLPFSPADLAGLTQRTAAVAEQPSGATRPVPLRLTDRPPLLVVDDDEVNRIVACGLAESLGYEVRTANDGVEAIEVCRRSAPAVVLMDLTMPRLGGIETARRLRELQCRGAVPPFAIVAVSADVNARDQCLAAGMDGYLTKPLLRAALSAELRRVCAGCTVPEG